MYSRKLLFISDLTEKLKCERNKIILGSIELEKNLKDKKHRSQCVKTFKQTQKQKFE